MTIGFHYSTQKEFEGGVEIIMHCCGLMFANQQVLTPME